MKTIRAILTLSLLVHVLVPAAARAGVADSPTPTLFGTKSLALFSVSGVVNAGGLGTFFSCTNVSSADAAISVELFADSGGDACNDASSVALMVAPGATVMFATQNVNSSFFSTQPLTAMPMFLPLGSARIVSTTKTLVCSAFLADAYSSPPMAMTPLVLAAKNKQKGG